MRITFKTPVVVYDGFTDQDDLKKLPAGRVRRLDGRRYQDTDSMADYFDDGLRELGIRQVGASIVLNYDPRKNILIATSVFHSPRELTDAELALLQEEYDGQMSDGTGEGFLQALAEEIDAEIDVLSLYDEDATSTVEVTEG